MVGVNHPVNTWAGIAALQLHRTLQFFLTIQCFPFLVCIHLLNYLVIGDYREMNLNIALASLLQWN